MHLLDIVAVLRNAMPKASSFNIFTALERQTDEVFVHSKLIAALIRPSYYPHAGQALQALLRQFSVPIDGSGGFRLTGIQVKTEFQGIDILVTNNAKQALIIENKIYAADQEQQLRRYYDAMRGLGYQEIYIRYLTLDGRDPSPKSLDGLDNELAAPWLANASYATDILLWLDDVASIAVRDSALRETVFQYQNVIQQLTGQGQERSYMNELVNTLLSSNNMLLARDISAAYTQGLIALQKTFWTDLVECIREYHPQIYDCLDSDSAADPQSLESLVAKYYEPAKRDKMYYGLYFSVPGFASTKVCIEIERALYFGVWCPDGRTSKAYKQTAQILRGATIMGESNQEWPHWRYIGIDYNFMCPDDSLLMMLCVPEQRADFTMACATSIAELWYALSGAAS
jgi:hypothetical protein